MKVCGPGPFLFEISELRTRSRFFNRELGTGLTEQGEAVNDEMMELKLSKTLKSLMKTSGETLASISRSTGIPKSTLSEWLSGRTPNPVQASKVAKLFDVSLHYFLFGIEDQSEPLTKLLKEDVFSGTFEINIKRVRMKGARSEKDE